MLEKQRGAQKSPVVDAKSMADCKTAALINNGPSKRHWASMILTVVLTSFAFMLYYNIPPIAGTIYNSIVAFIGAIILTISIVFLHKKDGDTFINVVGLFVGLVMVCYHVSRLITGIC